MPFKTSKLHPQRIQGDSRVTEAYKVIDTAVLDGEQVHEVAVQDFLFVLRNTTDFDVFIRSIATVYIPKEAPTPSMFMTSISYTLVGEFDDPIPS